jgi:glycine hydroxymethyltransferase
MITSGLRIGTPALATCGFDVDDFTEVADVVAKALLPGFDAARGHALRARVDALTERRPLYPGPVR